MTEATTDSPIEPVTGWPALTLTLRGVVLEVCAGACVIPLALEGVLPGRWYYWAIPIGTLAFTLLTIGVTMGFMSFSRSKNEMKRGYTTIWKVAVEHPELSYLSPYDFGVISGPGEPRPRNGTRKVVDPLRAHREPNRPTT